MQSTFILHRGMQKQLQHWMVMQSTTLKRRKHKGNQNPRLAGMVETWVSEDQK